MNTKYTNEYASSSQGQLQFLDSLGPCQYQSVSRDLDGLLSHSAPMAKQGLKASDKTRSPNNHSLDPLFVPSMVAAEVATIFNHGLEDWTQVRPLEMPRESPRSCGQSSALP